MATAVSQKYLSVCTVKPKQAYANFRGLRSLAGAEKVLASILLGLSCEIYLKAVRDIGVLLLTKAICCSTSASEQELFQTCSLWRKLSVKTIAKQCSHRVADETKRQ